MNRWRTALRQLPMLSPTRPEKKVAAELWCSLGLPGDALHRLHLSENPDPSVDSSFRLGTAAQTTIGLAGLSASYLHFLRTGVEQDVTVDARHAALEFHSEAWYTIHDEGLPKDLWDDIAGLYKTKGGGWVRIHTNFPHHRTGILDILGLTSAGTNRPDVQAALLTWDAVEFETAAASRGMCATALRSFDEWDQHPHAKALRGIQPVEIRKIGEAPKRAIGDLAKDDSKSPLEGLRVLDLSRVLAGPVAGRTLALHGATVLLVTSPHLPALPALDIDTSRGKRTTQLDLNMPADKSTLASLVQDADVFLQAYRPGGLAAKGFSPTEVAAMRPGIVCATLNAWGWEGEWKDRKGFDSLVQTATGFNVAEAEAYAAYQSGANKSKSDAATEFNGLQPRPLPMQALDHAAGYLLAFGINTALCKTITEGGSYEVRVSLAAVGQWIRSLGRLSPEQGFGSLKALPPRTMPPDEEIARLSKIWSESAGDEVEGNIGSQARLMSALQHAAVLSKTPVREGEGSEAPMALDKHEARWPGLSGKPSYT